MLILATLFNVATAAPVVLDEVRHPCEAAEDLGPDRYSRKSMVIFPLELPTSAMTMPAIAYRGQTPAGHPLADDRALLDTIGSGLFVVDYPLKRFDAWLAAETPVINGETLSGAASPRTSQALDCTDVAVVPRIADYTIEEGSSKTKNGKPYPTFDVGMRWEIDVYLRDGEALTLSQTLSVRVPKIVDLTEDTMNTARATSIEQLTQTIPGGAETVKASGKALQIYIAHLDEEQSVEVEQVLEQTQLAVTRVASVARPAWVLPLLSPGLSSHPGAAGLSWRGVENQCYINPPGPEEPDYRERALECELLNRSRQAVRALALQTRKVPEFQLFAPVTVAEGSDAGFGLGREEGLNVGDGYWLVEGTEKIGYARVQALGAGGSSDEPSNMQIVYGTPTAATLRGQENPQLGIEIGPWAGRLPARRVDATLPGDPLSGASRSLEAGNQTLSGSLRFDVNLGRMTERYELYQTNRLLFGGAGELGLFEAAFGVEQRFLLAPRLYTYGGAALAFQSWSVPSGEVYVDEDGDESEISAGTGRIGPELDTGLIVMVTPSVLVRGLVGLHASRAVEEFTWSKDNREGTVVPTPEDGSDFSLGTAGLVAGVATVWVF